MNLRSADVARRPVHPGIAAITGTVSENLIFLKDGCMRVLFGIPFHRLDSRLIGYLRTSLIDTGNRKFMIMDVGDLRWNSLQG
jgi:hypothetical protein